MSSDRYRNVYVDGAHMLAGDGALVNGSCMSNVELHRVYAMHDEEIHRSNGDPLYVRSFIALLRPCR